MQLLLLSNSTNSGEGFLEYAQSDITKFLQDTSGQIIFIPYAAVRLSYDDYELKVKAKFSDIGYNLVSLHHFENKEEQLKNASAIVVGGGNTFCLLHNLQKFRLLSVIRDLVTYGKPYIGWSAGSNLACPTICTTNDMPIQNIENFNALNLIPFQINPHYTDNFPVNFGGETRDERLFEYSIVNPNKVVVGLREGTLLHINDNAVKLCGTLPIKVFQFDKQPVEFCYSDNLNFLIH